MAATFFLAMKLKSYFSCKQEKNCFYVFIVFSRFTFHEKIEIIIL